MNSNMREQLNKLPALKAADYGHSVVQSISESVCHWTVDQWTLTWENSRTASLESSWLWPQCSTVNIRVSLPLNGWPVNSSMREQQNKLPALKAADYAHSVVQSISVSLPLNGWPMNSNMREQQNKLPALKAADYGHSVVQSISESVCQWTVDQWTLTWENNRTNYQPWKQLTMPTG